MALIEVNNFKEFLKSGCSSIISINHSPIEFNCGQTFLRRPAQPVLQIVIGILEIDHGEGRPVKRWIFLFRQWGVLLVDILNSIWRAMPILRCT